MKEHAVSSALILTDGKVVLIEIATGRTFGQYKCDLTKGHIEAGETSIDAIIREMKEETGLNIENERSSIIDLGKYFYTPSKDISLHMLYVEQLPSLDKYHCDSCFKTASGGLLPEVKDYKYVKLETLRQYLYKGFTPIIDDVLPRVQEIINSSKQQDMEIIFERVYNSHNKI